MFRRLTVISALLASTAASAQSRGVPQNGFPSWQERMLQVLFNRTRAEPSGTGDPNSCNATAVRPPVGYAYNLNRAARFHSANLSSTGCFQHNSPCLLFSDISARFPPNGTCSGSASCACANAAVCNSSCTAATCTQTFSRISLFGSSASGEIIAGGFDTPRGAWTGWMISPGHCSIITGNYGTVGTGWSNTTWTADFGIGAPTGPLIAGGHEVGTSFRQFTTTTAQDVSFRANYYNSAGAPQSAQVNIDGICTPMALERGSATNGTYLATVSLAGTACRRYVFTFKDPSGATVLLPETGTYGVGGSLASCPDWQAAPPASCSSGGNAAPTLATPAAAAPNPVTGTTTRLSVLGADDGGEAALTYTWSASGPAAVSFSANGANAAKSTVATFTRAGSYTFTVTLKDGGGRTVTSTVAVTVRQTPTSVAVTPATASVPLSGSLTFIATALDQFSNALSPQPSVAWTVSGGGSIGAASGVFTAGAVAGGPYTVTATAGGVSGTAKVTVASGSAPTVAAAAAASPNPVTGASTTISVLGADGGGEASLTYTWSASGPAAVVFSPNGTNAAKDTVATFAAAGSYVLTATVQAGSGMVATSSVTVTVEQVPAAVAVVPTSATTGVGGTVAFSAVAADQFGAALASQPQFTWSVSGGGSIADSGVFTASTAGGPFTVTATAGAVSGAAEVTVTPQSQDIADTGSAGCACNSGGGGLAALLGLALLARRRLKR